MPVALPEDAMSDADRKFYASFSAPDFNSPVPWNEGPRRMGTDKNGDVLWVGNSWGGTLAKINTHTMETSFVPLPGPGVMQPYHVAVDSHHNAWLNIWMTDQVLKYDPSTNAFTFPSTSATSPSSPSVAAITSASRAASVSGPMERLSIPVRTLRHSSRSRRLPSRCFPEYGSIAYSCRSVK